MQAVCWKYVKDGRWHAEIWLRVDPGVAHDAIIRPNQRMHARGWGTKRGAEDWVARTLARCGLGDNAVWISDP